MTSWVSAGPVGADLRSRGGVPRGPSRRGALCGEDFHWSLGRLGQGARAGNRGWQGGDINYGGNRAPKLG